jgi:type I restriction enzyme S subunit
LKNEYIDSLLIPDISDSDQLHIANILTKAENLIAQRKESIRLLDDFLKSTFLEMFGDPLVNSKQWRIIKIKDCGKIVTGTTPPSSKDGMFGGEIPFITPSDLESDEPNRRFVTELGAENSRTVRKGATFICCIGATIGKVQRAKVLSAFNQQLNAIEWNNNFNDLFGERLMRFMKPKIIAKGGGSTTLPILNKGDFEKLEIIHPPIELQTQFAQIVEKTEALKTQYQQSLTELENLYGSLSQKAFKGELTRNEKTTI